MRILSISLSALLLFVGCDGDGAGAIEVADAALEASDAEIENYQLADGCSWIVRVGDSEYAPDEASLIKIQAFTKGAFGTTHAEIQYKLTGNDGNVVCGDEANLVVLPEVVVMEISAP